MQAYGFWGVFEILDFYSLYEEMSFLMDVCIGPIGVGSTIFWFKCRHILKDFLYLIISYKNAVFDCLAFLILIN